MECQTGPYTIHTILCWMRIRLACQQACISQLNSLSMPRDDFETFISLPFCGISQPERIRSCFSKRDAWSLGHGQILGWKGSSIARYLRVSKGGLGEFCIFFTNIISGGWMEWHI